MKKRSKNNKKPKNKKMQPLINYDMSKAIKYGAIAIILLAILGFLFIRIGNNKKKL